MSNPFFETWQTPFNMPPFETIQDHHFEAAFEQGFSEHWAEIEAIANNPAPASFDNTLVALEASGFAVIALAKRRRPQALVYGVAVLRAGAAFASVEGHQCSVQPGARHEVEPSEFCANARCINVAAELRNRTQCGS